MISINIDKAKEISHSIRREARSNELAPLDIKATIPNYSYIAEAMRKQIRDKYADFQIQIDNATSPNELKDILESIKTQVPPKEQDSPQVIAVEQFIATKIREAKTLEDSGDMTGAIELRLKYGLL